MQTAAVLELLHLYAFEQVDLVLVHVCDATEGLTAVTVDGQLVRRDSHEVHQDLAAFPELVPVVLLASEPLQLASRVALQLNEHVGHVRLEREQL